MSKLLVVSFLFIVMTMTVHAQRGPSNYTVLQAGGLVGVKHSLEDKPMSGYQFQFIFGRNFYNENFLGVGIGNDIYRGKSTLADGRVSNRRVSTLPIFVDYRAPIAFLSVFSRLGVMANAGYAPSISTDYFKGFIGKGGLYYSYVLAERSSLILSAGYNFQQFQPRFRQGTSFDQHSIYINIGLFAF